MKLIKLTASAFLFFSSVIMFSSCEQDPEQKKTTDFSKSGIVLSSAQEVPANPSTALGSMDVYYSRDTRILSYSINWTGLTGAPTAIHLHGLATAGYAATAAPVQLILGASGAGGIFTAGSAFPATGKLSGTLLVDGVVVKENDLLAGKYYIHIHTATYSTTLVNGFLDRGEIRGQIVFQ